MNDLFLLATSHQQAGHPAEAYRVLEIAYRRWPERKAALARYVQATMEMGEYESGETALQAMHALNPGWSLRLTLKMARYLLRANEVPVALRLLAWIRGLHPHDVALAKVESDCLMRQGAIRQAIDLWEDLDRSSDCLDADALMRYSDLLERIGKPELARWSQAHEIDRANAPVAARFAQRLFLEGNVDAAECVLAEALKHPLSANETVRLELSRAQLLLTRGRFQEASEALARARDLKNDNPRLADELALLWRLLSAQSPSPSLSDATRRSPSEEMPGIPNGAPDALYHEAEWIMGKTVLHFPSSSGRYALILAPYTISGMAKILKACLQPLRKADLGVLAINDRRRSLCLAGFGDYFPSRRAAEDALLSVLESQSATELITIGNSGAGYSALLYGCEMEARGVLSFAGLTYLPDPAHPIDGRAIKPVQRLLRSFPIDIVDARPLVETHPHVMVHLYFNQCSEFDRAQAKHIRDFSNVHLYPVSADHSDHGILPWLQEHGLLVGTINGFLAELGWRG
jgi:tetratricopeptide (TPR) repeat protein